MRWEVPLSLKIARSNNHSELKEQTEEVVLLEPRLPSTNSHQSGDTASARDTACNRERKREMPDFSYQGLLP